MVQRRFCRYAVMRQAHLSIIQSYEYYLSKGMSEQEASRQTAIDLAEQVIMSGVSGAVMGVGFGAMSGVNAFRGQETTQTATLTPEQIMEAIAEAFSGTQILNNVTEQIRDMDPSQASPILSEAADQMHAATEASIAEAQAVLDKRLSAQQTAKDTAGIDTETTEQPEQVRIQESDSEIENIIISAHGSPELQSTIDARAKAAQMGFYWKTGEIINGIFDNSVGTIENPATPSQVNDYIEYSMRYAKEQRVNGDKDFPHQIDRITTGRVSDKERTDLTRSYPTLTIPSQHTLVDNDLRHMINSHGEGTNEKYPVTIEDLKRIPNIIENYDDILYVPRTDGKQGIIYIKQHNGVTYYLEKIQEGDNSLSNKQMIKISTGTIPNLNGLKEAIEKKWGSLSAPDEHVPRMYVHDVKSTTLTDNYIRSGEEVKDFNNSQTDSNDKGGNDQGNSGGNTPPPSGAAPAGGSPAAPPSNSASGTTASSIKTGQKEWASDNLTREVISRASGTTSNGIKTDQSVLPKIDYNRALAEGTQRPYVNKNAYTLEGGARR